MNILTQLDRTVFDWINAGWSSSILDFIMPLISHLGDSYAVWLWIAFIGLLTGWQLIHLTKTNKEVKSKYEVIKAIGFLCLYMALIFGLNAGAYTGLKHLFFRPRPFVQQSVIVRVSNAAISGLKKNGSFPSGHACNAFMVAVFLASRIRQRRYVFYVMAAMVALSRVYLGVHYPSDVIMGALLGWTITSLMLHFQLSAIKNC